jgi:signal transduction histidine kinase
VLVALPQVMEDGEAVSLLHTIDASCTVLLRIVSNLLQMRTLQRDGALPLAQPRVFNLPDCVQRCVRVVQMLDCVPSRLTWTGQYTPDPPLPERVLGDEAALTACMHNMLITSMLWLPHGQPLHLHIGAYAEGEEPEEAVLPAGVQLSVTAQKAVQDSSSVAGASPRMFTLRVSVTTPGRPLTGAEVDAAFAPFSMLPADKGGGTGLALFVARGTAATLGGELTVPTPRAEGTLLMLRVPLHVVEDDAMPDFSTTEAAAAAAEDAPVAPAPSSSLPLPPPPPGAEEVAMTSRMFECLLINSDDVFALCHFTPVDPGDDTSELYVFIDYVSPSVTWRLQFAQEDVVGRNLLDVCHPEDRAAFLSALHLAHSTGGHVNYVHRNLRADGGEIWCHTSAHCMADSLVVVCRDMRTNASVELALRSFMLATSHDMREPCNTILMAASVLERRPCVAAHEEVADLVGAIRSACGLLLGIVGAAASALAWLWHCGLPPLTPQRRPQGMS